MHGLKKENIKKIIITTVVVMLLLLVFWWASGENLYYTSTKTSTPAPSATAALIDEDTVLEFPFVAECDQIEKISLMINTFGRADNGTILLELLDDNGAVIAAQYMDTSTMIDYSYNDLTFRNAVDVVKDKSYVLRISAQNAPKGMGIGIWSGDSISTGRFQIKVQGLKGFTVNGEHMDGSICCSIIGRKRVWLGDAYPWISIGIIVVFFSYSVFTERCRQKGKKNRYLELEDTCIRYGFLMKQLVLRDFKLKYKRSALGMLWSLLNPLLTMLVQYVVFNTLFRSNVENFVVYLLSAVVIMNFFSESVNLCLSSITDNSALINKVYVPIIVYPISRVLSSAINLLVSLIPLFGVTFITGLSPTRKYFLIPICLILLSFFSLGLGMLLGTMMVYFRDVKFLWGVLFTLWSYMTPSFYPITIIPESIRGIFKMNPLYCYLTFVRTVLIDGESPSMYIYLGCFLSALVMMLIGYTTFKKHEKEFVYNL